MIYNPVMKESVKVGDVAAVQELDNIKDVLIIISYESRDTDYGTVVYVGERDTEEARSYVWKAGTILSFVYNDSEEENTDYDE